MRLWVAVGGLVALGSFLFLWLVRSHPPVLAAIGAGSLGLLVTLTALSMRRLHRELTTPLFTVEEGLRREEERPEGGDDARGS